MYADQSREVSQLWLIRTDIVRFMKIKWTAQDAVDAAYLNKIMLTRPVTYGDAPGTKLRQNIQESADDPIHVRPIADQRFKLRRHS